MYVRSIRRRKRAPGHRGFHLLIVAISIPLLCGVTGLVFHRPLLRELARLLIVSDRPMQADAIVLLNGEDTRAVTAAELYAKGYAPVVLIAQVEERPSQSLEIWPNSTERAVSSLMSQGVPRDSIVVLDDGSGVTSTYDEAVVHCGYMHVQGLERVLLVTSAFHTRRARWSFKRAGSRHLSQWKGTLVVVGSPHVGFDETDWWKTERGLVTLNNEYLKLAYYIVTKS